MQLKEPVFIVGTGRCGSTIFQQVLCEHPSLAWLSAVFDTSFAQPAHNRLLMGVVDLPVVGDYLKKQKILKPWEPYKIWDRYFPGFSEPNRDLRSDDVTNRVRQSMQQAMAQMLTPKRDRLLAKITGWPRVGFLHEVFPDAKFIHIVRDGRAVVNSLLNVDWWSGWRGPENWRWGELTPAQRAAWERHGKSFIALASIEWNILIDAMEEARACYTTPENFLEIRYEDFCTDTVDTLRTVAAFCHLSWTPTFEQAVGQYQLRNTNFKWQKELTTHQQDIMLDIMGERLQRYGYL